MHAFVFSLLELRLLGCLSSLQNNPLRERAVITARAQWLGCTVCNGLGGCTACSVANLRKVASKQVQ